MANFWIYRQHLIFFSPFVAIFEKMTKLCLQTVDLVWNRSKMSPFLQTVLLSSLPSQPTIIIIGVPIAPKVATTAILLPVLIKGGLIAKDLNPRVPCGPKKLASLRWKMPRGWVGLIWRLVMERSPGHRSVGRLGCRGHRSSPTWLSLSYYIILTPLSLSVFKLKIGVQRSMEQSDLVEWTIWQWTPSIGFK